MRGEGVRHPMTFVQKWLLPLKCSFIFALIDCWFLLGTNVPILSCNISRVMYEN
jgi:hypothetical protein